jgi:type II secretory pathway pseudopilin PulG
MRALGWIRRDWSTRACLRADRKCATTSSSTADDGKMLLGLIVMIAIILFTLAIAAPKVALALRRDREELAVDRANQYVRAIQLYYRKFGRYPSTVDQLENSNNIRFLRRRFVDPMTGKDDWRLIPVGANKTTVTVFFGQPLGGVAGGGLGSASSSASGIGGTQTVNGSTTGTTGSTGSAFGGLASSAGGTNTGTATGIGTTGTSGSGLAGSSANGSSSSGSGAQVSLPFMGIGSSAKGSSILTVNTMDKYEDWEFLYDPRIEQLKAKSSLFGGGIASSSGTTGLGSSTSGIGSGPGSGTSPGTGISGVGTSGTGTGTGTGTGVSTGTGSSGTSTAPQ